MTKHQVIRQEIEHATAAINEFNSNIEKLAAQRDRIAMFVEAMEEAIKLMPEQLEFVIDDTPQNVAEFKQ